MGQIKKEIFSGVLYSAIAKYSGIFVSLIVSMILARLLRPEQFGTVAIATIFISLFSTLTTVGLSPAIVQDKTIDDKELAGINTFTFFIAILFTAIYLLCIPLILSLYKGYTLLSNTLYLLSLNVFFSIASIVPGAMFLKNRQFKYIGIRTLIIQALVGIISVVGALEGMGIYALLVNPILGSILLFAISFYIYPIGFKRMTVGALKKIISFSTFQMLFNITYLLYRNVDKIFIGKLFGANTLGYYEKSYRLMMMPLENISGVISPVLHPVLSDYQNEPIYIWNAYLKLVAVLAEIGFLLTVIIYFCSDSLIILVYGTQWTSAIPMFKILSLSIGFQIIQSPIGAILQSINKVKGLFLSSLWILAFIVIFIYLSFLIGNITVLLYGVVFSFLVGFIIYQIYLTYYLQTDLKEIFRVILRPIMLSAILFLLIYMGSLFLGIQKESITYLLITVLFSSVYVFSMIKLGFLPNLKNIMFSVKNKEKNENSTY